MREPAKRFEDLVVWQKAHRFVLAVYRLTRSFPVLKSAAFLPNSAGRAYPAPRISLKEETRNLLEAQCH